MTRRAHPLPLLPSLPSWLLGFPLNQEMGWEDFEHLLQPTKRDPTLRQQQLQLMKFVSKELREVSSLFSLSFLRPDSWGRLIS